MTNGSDGLYNLQPELLRAPRRVSRPVLVGTASSTLVLGLVIGYAAGHRGTQPTTRGPSDVVTNIGGDPPIQIPTTAAGPLGPAKQGDAITLTGNDKGEKASVTFVKIVDPAAGTDEFSRPASGTRFVAVQFRITDAGTAAYSDSPTNGAELIDSAGQYYSPELFSDTTAGPSFPGQVDITPGGSALGVIVFQVPTAAKPTQVQFGMDSGFGQKGRWEVG